MFADVTMTVTLINIKSINDKLSYTFRLQLAPSQREAPTVPLWVLSGFSCPVSCPPVSRGGSVMYIPTSSVSS